MVVVQVRQEDPVNLVAGDANLVQPHRGPAPGVEQQFVVARLDQDRLAETLDVRPRRAGAQQRHSEHLSRGRRGQQHQDKNDSGPSHGSSFRIAINAS